MGDVVASIFSRWMMRLSWIGGVLWRQQAAGRWTHYPMSNVSEIAALPLVCVTSWFEHSLQVEIPLSIFFLA